jgi:hypothetical protein
VKESNGKIVWQQLEKAIEKTGIPREIIGDHGSDLAKWSRGWDILRRGIFLS